MYFAVMKISFEQSSTQNRKDLAALVDKLRARFRICAMSCSTSEDDGEASIAITSLAHSEEALSKQLDSISEFCENAGLGRISDEKTLLDHLDSFGEDDDGE